MFKPLHRSLLSAIPSTPPLLPLRHLRPFAFPLTTYSSKNIQTRKMSSAPAKKEFLCILPDKQGVLEKRLEVRGLVSFLCFLYKGYDFYKGGTDDYIETT